MELTVLEAQRPRALWYHPVGLAPDSASDLSENSAEWDFEF